MARLLNLLFFFLLSASIYGAGEWNGIFVTKWNGSGVTKWNGTSVKAVTYEINESFEGSGTPTGWVTTNVVSTSTKDFDSTASPTDAAQSLLLTKGTGNCWVYKNFAISTTRTEVWVVFSYKPGAVGAVQSILSIDLPNDGAVKGFLSLDSTSHLKIWADNQSGSPSKVTTDAMSSSTQYYIKAHWNHVSGAYDCEFSTTRVFTGSGTKYINGTDGLTTSVNFGEISVYASPTSTQTGDFDLVQVATVAIP